MVSVSLTSWLAIVIAFILIGVLIFNVIYIGEVRKEIAGGTRTTLSKGAADAIFAIDIILIILLFIYIGISFYFIATTKEERTAHAQTVTSTVSQVSQKAAAPRSGVLSRKNTITTTGLTENPQTPARYQTLTERTANTQV